MASILRHRVQVLRGLAALICVLASAALASKALESRIEQALAVGFLIAAAGYFFEAREKPGRRGWRLASMSANLCGSLAIVLLVDAFIFKEGRGISAGALLAAACLFLTALDHGRQCFLKSPPGYQRRWLPLVSAAAVITLGAGLWGSGNELEQKNLRLEVRKEANRLLADFYNQIQQQRNFLSLLVHFQDRRQMVLDPAMVHSLNEMSALFHGFEGLVIIPAADPMQGQMLAGDLYNDPSWARFVQVHFPYLKARYAEGSGTVVSPVFRCAGDQPCLFISHRGGNFEIVVTRWNLHTWLAAHAQHTIALGYSGELLGPQGESIAFGPSAEQRDVALARRPEDFSLLWQLRLWPTEARRREAKSVFPLLLFVGGAIFSVFTFLFVQRWQEKDCHIRLIELRQQSLLRRRRRARMAAEQAERVRSARFQRLRASSAGQAPCPDTGESCEVLHLSELLERLRLPGITRLHVRPDAPGRLMTDASSLPCLVRDLARLLPVTSCGLALRLRVDAQHGEHCQLHFSLRSACEEEVTLPPELAERFHRHGARVGIRRRRRIGVVAWFTWPVRCLSDHSTLRELGEAVSDSATPSAFAPREA
jgi:hypothetical protein